MPAQITFKTRAGLEAMGDGWEEHTNIENPVAELNAREYHRIFGEIAQHPAVLDVCVNGRDYEGILCVQITTQPALDFDLYCVYESGSVALHNINQPQSYSTFDDFWQNRKPQEQNGHRGHPSEDEVRKAAVVRGRIGVILVRLNEQGFSYDEAMAFLTATAMEIGRDQGECWSGPHEAAKTVQNVFGGGAGKGWSLATIHEAITRIHYAIDS